MGQSWEDATERGEITGHLGEFLLCGDTCSVVVWGGDLGVVGANDSETKGISCGVPETGDKVEDKNYEGLFVAEGCIGQSVSGSGDKTAPDLLEQEACGSGGMGDLMAYLQGLCKGEGL